MRNHLRLGLVLAVAVSGACVAACGGDDTADPTGAGGSGGSGGATGSAGKGGATGTAGKGGSSTGGSAGTGGKATGGTAGGGGSPTDSGVTDGKADAGDCGSSGVIRTAPTVPAAIAAPSGVVLVGGYRASGEQIYTCTPAAAVDAGATGDAEATDAAAEGAVPAVTGTWVNTATAVLFGDNCTKAADHSYTGTTPTWAAVPDGSKVLAVRDKVTPAPTADGGDAAVTDIPWVLLKATSNSGEGIFTNVTYVHRTDTKGGVGPSGACSPGDATPVQRVPYLATYYFYTGGNSEGGTAEGGGEASSETSVSTDAGADVSLPGDAAVE